MRKPTSHSSLIKEKQQKARILKELVWLRLSI